ncbi:U3 small nucleolar RNA-associated protein 5 [Microdochium nivale]|nr:U3 small nucleolar RNA-associated protein 5 [Microdochium nivale]
MSTKRKATSKIAQPVVKQSAKKATRANINESETAVSGPDVLTSADITADKQDAIEISSDSASSEYEGSDDEGVGKDTGGTSEEAVVSDGTTAQQTTKAVAGQDTDMPSADDAESDQEPTQPTFGELVRVEEIIDVPSALLPPTNALAAAGRVLAPPSSASLGTVLTQALRTDDNDLLESCLHTTDLNTVSNTIQRLDSSLAGTLLTKLASRMHRRPGRAGSLMTWVQWTLVAHGGALATQPDLTKKLGELHRVLEERSRGLTSLLSLKGKLDLLESQMQLRRGIRNGVDSDDEDSDEEEQGIVYVEGEEDASELGRTGFEVEDDDGLPVTNGFADDDSEDSEEASDLDEENDDDELEGGEDLDENEVNHDDVSSDEDSEGEGEPAPPAKRSRTTAAASKRR